MNSAEILVPSHSYLVWLWRELRVSVPAQVLCTWFLSALFHRPFFVLLAEVACVGFTIHFFIEAGRYGMAWALRRWLPHHPSARYGWPGWVWMAPWSTLSCVFGFYFGTLLGNVLLNTRRAPEAILQHPIELLIVTTVIFLATTACVCYIYVKGRLTLLEMQKQMALRSAAEHQLKLLESQLEPHMLFNTLANLRVLIGMDTEKAQLMLDKLTDFLRASLSASRASTHSLRQEFDRIEDYLSLMQIRMGARLRFELNLEPAIAQCAIPPLLLQPLVENAIKHGIDPISEPADILISARKNQHQIELLVQDTGAGYRAAPLPQQGQSHFGLQQVKERLHSIYGETASFHIEALNKNIGTIARIQIPFSTSEFAK